MCSTCGCGGSGSKITIAKPSELIYGGHHSHNHHHDHDHHRHSHHHDQSRDHHHERKISVEVGVLHQNNLLAERNRGFFEARQVTVLNVMSSPGSGKTTLLEKTIEKLKETRAIAVIEGDQQTMNDARRIEKAGAPAIQVNTGNGCHLDASMIQKAVKKLELKEGSVLFIENVGNLVCPSLFDLGEAQRVVIISVTEGDDKPAKYPTMFENSHLCIINKIDLLPYVDFDVQKVKSEALKVNHHLTFMEVSAKTGQGMNTWIEWLNQI